MILFIENHLRFCFFPDQLEEEFDPMVFEKILSELFPSDPNLLKESSIDLSFPLVESEPPTREIGTDPMEPSPPTLPIIIQTIPQLQSDTAATNMPIDCFTFEIDSSLFPTNDYQMEDVLPLTPSTSSESPDEPASNSPDSANSSMLTNFDVSEKEIFLCSAVHDVFLFQNLPARGPLVLTKEEVKIIQQEGYEVPTKLPLSKSEEKLLKKVRRKIKNKVSRRREENGTF